MGGLLGGSKQKSTSSNQAFGTLNTAFSPVLGATGTGANALQALLGLGGDTAAADQGFQRFRDSSGYNFQMDQGSRAITGNAASRGLLNSGSTAKALQTFGQGMADQSFNSYLDNLLQYSNLGLQAGQVLGGAGQQTQSSGKSKKGLGGVVGGLGSMFAASDRRLKKNIFKVGELDNGLNVYQYRYISGAGPYIGVMADEVEKIVPEALGPEIDGYKTVDYSKLEAVKNG